MSDNHVIVVSPGGAKVFQNIRDRLGMLEATYGWNDSRTQAAYRSFAHMAAMLLGGGSGPVTTVGWDSDLSLYCQDHRLLREPEVGDMVMNYGIIGHESWLPPSRDGAVRQRDPLAVKWEFHS